MILRAALLRSATVSQIWQKASLSAIATLLQPVRQAFADDPTARQKRCQSWLKLHSLLLRACGMLARREPHRHGVIDMPTD